MRHKPKPFLTWEIYIARAMPGWAAGHVPNLAHLAKPANGTPRPA